MKWRSVSSKYASIVNQTFKDDSSSFLCWIIKKLSETGEDPKFGHDYSIDCRRRHFYRGFEKKKMERQKALHDNAS